MRTYFTLALMAVGISALQVQKLLENQLTAAQIETDLASSAEMKFLKGH